MKISIIEGDIVQISRITKVRSGGKDFIRLYGYDESGKLLKVAKQYQNFVFVSDDKLSDVPHGYNIDNRREYKPYDYNLNVSKLYKVYIGKKSVVPQKLKQISYQSDISMELKYILDNDLQFSRKRHIAFIDIETYFDIDDPDGNLPDNPRAPITSITMYSNILNKYMVFTWHPMIEVSQEQIFKLQQLSDDKFIYVCHDEAAMLSMFTTMIKDGGVDIITGWYSHGYDIPYIIKRCGIVLKDSNALSPQGNAWMGSKNQMNEYYPIRLSGIDSIDLMQAVQKMNYNLQNNKLDTAAEEILGSEYKKLQSSSWKDWLQNFDGFLQYAIRDVEILRLIDDKLKIFEYLIQMQILSSIPYMNDIQSPIKLIDTILIKRNWNTLVFPNIKKKDRVLYKGAIVLDPTEPGVHTNVAVCDYASLYPTTAIAYNISPETFLMSESKIGNAQLTKQLDMLKSHNIGYVDTEHHQDLYGKRYIFLSQSQHLGVIPAMLKDLYELRRKYKKLAKDVTDPDEQMVYDKKQYAIKIILNSTYGALGFPSFRIYTPQCADAITYWGRVALEYGIEYFNKYGKILYGDTDSIVLKFDDLDIFKTAIQKYNKSELYKLVRRYNPSISKQFMFYDLQFEKLLSHIYYSDAKKRYYSIQDSGKKYIHGLNIIKKDTPPLIRSMLDDMCELAVRGGFSINVLKDAYSRIKRAPYDEIAVHKAIRKQFTSYVKTIPQHVAGALFANEILDLKLRNSDVVYLFYINNFVQPDRKINDRNNVICLRKEDFHHIESTDKFKIDYQELMQKQIIQPMRQFNYVPQVKLAIHQWCKEYSDNYRLKKDGDYAFKKIKF